MAIGLSLHLGLNQVDPHHYSGWTGPLIACELDANDMQAIAAASGFETRKLLTASCTRAAVTDSLEMAVDLLADGDIFLWTASCHGGQIPDEEGDESDTLDETLCLFDGQWLDDETARMLGRFRSGVRVVVIADACHTGSSDRSRGERAMPPEVALGTFLENRRFYDALMLDLTRSGLPKRNAATLTLGACLDDQTAADGRRNGRFTAALKNVWNQGAFAGDYVGLHDAIRRRMPPTQTPSLNLEGPLSNQLGAQHPFSVEGNNGMTGRSEAKPREWSNASDAPHGDLTWGRGEPGSAKPARPPAGGYKTLNDGDYVTNRRAPSILYRVTDGQLQSVPPPDAVATGVTQADVHHVDPLVLATLPVSAQRGRDQTFHWWSDLDAGHFMESWAWFPPGKVAVRTITRTVTWFGGYTGRVKVFLVAPNGEIIPEVDITQAYGVDGTAFGSGTRDETFEWDVPQSVLDRVDSVAFLHCWDPKIDLVAEAIKWIKFIWDIYSTLADEEGVSAGSETV